MDINRMLEDLRAEVERLHQAIHTIEQLEGSVRRRGRPRKASRASQAQEASGAGAEIEPLA
jgi:hypothetical protein